MSGGFEEGLLYLEHIDSRMSCHGDDMFIN